MSPTGSGQIAEAAIQVIVGANITFATEAMVVAEAAGADVAKLSEARRGGFASSRTMELHGQEMIDRTFGPGERVSSTQGSRASQRTGGIARS